jgi:hypothetical protein
VIHQFTLDMIDDRSKLKPRKGLAITLNADGFGTHAAKLDKYRTFTPRPERCTTATSCSTRRTRTS